VTTVLYPVNVSAFSAISNRHSGSEGEQEGGFRTMNRWGRRPHQDQDVSRRSINPDMAGKISGKKLTRGWK
jgi:hypothetical protein